MKNLKITAMALLMAAGVTAQDISLTDVPSELKNNFEKKYPQAQDQEWEMEGNLYKVEFEINRNDHEIWYTKDGKISKMEREITSQELPTPILNTLKKSYSEYKLDDDITRIEKEGRITYQVDIEHQNTEKMIEFTENGEVINEFND